MQHHRNPSGGPSLFNDSDPENNESPASPGRRDVTTEWDLEKLGRQRPDVFQSTLSEVFFSASMLVSMLMSVSDFPPFPFLLEIPSHSWP